MSVAGISWFAVSILSFLLDVGAVFKVSDVTLPVCRIVNGSLDCPVPCLDGLWEVTVLLVGKNGTKFTTRISTDFSGMVPNNVTSMTYLRDAKDENGYNGTLVTYKGSCCRYKVKISAVDEEGNKIHCNFSVRWPNSTMTKPNKAIHPIRVTQLTVKTQPRQSLSNSPRITVSFWTTVVLLALTTPLL